MIFQQNKYLVSIQLNLISYRGGVNIYSSLEEALSLLKNDYLSGERVASMILLSDRADNNSSDVDDFKNLLIKEGKDKYAFTLHCFGFGDYHNAKLLNDISKIKDGSYFYIQRTGDFKNAFLTIYGSLSTVNKVNLEIIIQSSYTIQKVYGMEDMYEASLTNNNSTFNTKIIQVVYGKVYTFVVLVNIPKDIKTGNEVLKVTVSPLGITTRYLWANSYNSFAYEEYIRCICFTYISDGFYRSNDGSTIINNGLKWIQSNYNGARNWEEEFKTILDDFNNYNTYGKANILSRLRELKTSKFGIHYIYMNSYIMNIIEMVK